jgi:deoxyribodipyrimidine photo-lyase
MALALQYLGGCSTLRGLALKFACEASMPPLPHTPWSQTLPPTHRAATARVASINPAAYARTRNHLQGAVTGLSPYLTHGLMTLPEVLAQVIQNHALAVGHKLVFELGWREYFRHVWRHAGPGIFQSMQVGPLPDSAYATELPPDIAQGRTGVPVIDQAVRALYATGTLHNHARMWLASYLVHVRRVHWRAGADWLVAHLLDGDLASNHLSWQWVAGTGSHKPYLFNADNVARYAPAAWHSPGTVIDQSYEALERLARGQVGPVAPAPIDALSPITEAACHAAPPSGLNIPDALAGPSPSGRQVWLLHPWALRAPPSDLPRDALVIGLYLKEHHAAWPWPEARWQWVDAAMQAVAPLRWWTDAQGLACALRGAARVRTVDDPHISPWLKPLAEIEPAPALFPPVERHCSSFSQWWNRTTRGLKGAEELL